MEPRHNELLATLFKLTAAEFSRCFAPPELCGESAIRAHSVQNARTLDLLATNGHVAAITKRFAANRVPEIEFGVVGRNKATTFAGLCATHDRTIFSPIEAAPFDPGSAEHLFLAAYRATFREVHASCAAGWMLQMGYQKRVQLGFDPDNGPSDAGLLATRQLILAYETFNYKLTFDDAFLRRDFSRIQHDVIHIGVPRPTLAACSLFSIDDAVRGDDVARACLNVLPLTRTETIAILSYTAADAPLARAALDRILSSSGEHQRYELSKRLLNSCENFVIAPDHFQTWSARKRKVIRDYYVQTLLRDHLGHDDPELCVF